MKYVHLFFIAGAGLAGFSAWAATDSGSWQGTGSHMTGDQIPAATAQMSLSVSMNDTSLTIHDCWADQGPRALQQCNDSKYDVDDNGGVLNRGIKIGDVYPGQIIIFTGNDQASEQMRFDFEKDTMAASNGVRYQYTLSTFDGSLQIRRGQLSKGQ